jgi:hypothetical protein
VELPDAGRVGAPLAGAGARLTGLPLETPPPGFVAWVRWSPGARASVAGHQELVPVLSPPPPGANFRNARAAAC